MVPNMRFQPLLFHIWKDIISPFWVFLFLQWKPYQPLVKTCETCIEPVITDSSTLTFLLGFQTI